MESEQAALDTYRELNRYDDRHKDYRSSAVYESPRRTVGNHWMKFHATRDCGTGKVYYIESTTRGTASEKYGFDLRCWDCGHRVDEDEVLFIGGDWYGQEGILAYGDTADKLNLPADRVLDLGPDPDREELLHALELTHIEQKVGPFAGGPLRPEQGGECEDCDHAVPLLFGDYCRMCYDGEWTERMQNALKAYERKIRVWHNDSFVHRLESHVDPLSTKGRAFEDKVLWRRRDDEDTTKLVVVKQCLQDDADGHWEYVLTDLTHTYEWRYHEHDLADCFWDTCLYDREQGQPGQEGKLRETHQRVCDHSFHTVYDTETLESIGEQCSKCNLKRGNK
ncbi:hypothetical protein [Haloarcula amylovorans]|uniref:hypothetical protein n=1 Tax=Haloarcula amylovorans TaxID=2562280 RepID=UPI0010767B1C|nr:hypothetical protein [Halomicroarcula amylolytica]